MPDFSMFSDSEDDHNPSDEELQEAFAKGDLKPGLNIELNPKVERKNDILKMAAKLDEMKQDLPWLERMDIVNNLAPIAPELVIQLEKHEQKRANVFKGNAKIPYIKPDEDPVLNDFKREVIFHRQAQQAVIDGIKKLHELGVATRRPDDYYAEMAKTDVHMQKIRSNLMAKQEGQAKSERIRQIREQRKMGKLINKQQKVNREAEKKTMLDQLKKFRKGKLKNLDFLEDAKALQAKKKQSAESRKSRNKKFGFGGKKKGMKRNTKSSAAGLDKTKTFKSKRGVKAAPGANKRLGKSRRMKARSKK